MKELHDISMARPRPRAQSSSSSSSETGLTAPPRKEKNEDENIVQVSIDGTDSTVSESIKEEKEKRFLF